MSWGSLDGRGVCGRMGHVYVWLSPLNVHLKLSQHCLLISYTKIQNKNLINVRRNKKKVLLCKYKFVQLFPDLAALESSSSPSQKERWESGCLWLFIFLCTVIKRLNYLSTPISKQAPLVLCNNPLAGCSIITQNPNGVHFLTVHYPFPYIKSFI